jgi:hypothetical protein
MTNGASAVMLTVVSLTASQITEGNDKGGEYKQNRSGRYATSPTYCRVHFKVSLMAFTPDP